MAERIDRAWLTEHACSKFEMSLSMSACHRTVHSVFDKRTGAQIGLGFTDVSWKRQKRNGPKGGTCQRLWHVTNHDAHIETLDDALEILAIIRAGETL